MQKEKHNERIWEIKMPDLGWEKQSKRCNERTHGFGAGNAKFGRLEMQRERRGKVEKEKPFQRLVGRGVGWHLGAQMGVLAKLDSPHWSTRQAQRSHIRRGPICTTHRREDIKKGCGGTQASGDPPCPIDPTTPRNGRGAVCPGPTLTPLYPIDPIPT